MMKGANLQKSQEHPKMMRGPGVETGGAVETPSHDLVTTFFDLVTARPLRSQLSQVAGRLSISIE